MTGPTGSRGRGGRVPQSELHVVGSEFASRRHGWGARPGGAGRAPLARGPTPPRAHPRPQRPNGSKWLPVEAALSLSLSLSVSLLLVTDQTDPKLLIAKGRIGHWALLGAEG